MANPQFRLSELDKPSEDLFALISSQFEGAFDPLSYHAIFKLPVLPSAPVFMDGSLANIFANGLFDRKLDDCKRWEVEVGFVQSLGRLGINSLAMPLDGTTQSLVLQREPAQPHDYFSLSRRQRVGKSTVASTGHKDTLIPDQTFSEHEVERTFALANYHVPQVFTTPDDLHLWLADITGMADEWATIEKKTFFEDMNAQLVIQRNNASERRRGRNQISTELSATRHDLSKEGDFREQLDIVFKAIDWFVSPPTLKARVFSKVSEDSDGPAGPDFVLANEVALLPTPRLLGILSESVVDVLS